MASVPDLNIHSSHSSQVSLSSVENVANLHPEKFASVQYILYQINWETRKAFALKEWVLVNMSQTDLVILMCFFAK